MQPSEDLHLKIKPGLISAYRRALSLALLGLSTKTKAKNVGARQIGLSEAHAEYVMDDEAKKYTPQVQYSLWVTGLSQWWFMSYYPGLRPLLKSVEPDEKWHKAFDQYVPGFLDEVEEAKRRLS